MHQLRLELYNRVEHWLGFYPFSFKKGAKKKWQTELVAQLHAWLQESRHDNDNIIGGIKSKQLSITLIESLCPHHIFTGMWAKD